MQKNKQNKQPVGLWIVLTVCIIVGLFVWKNFHFIVSVSDYTVEITWDTQELKEGNMVLIHGLLDGEWKCEAIKPFFDDSFTVSQEYLEAEGMAFNFFFEDGNVPEVLCMKGISIFYKNHLIGYLENTTVTDSIEKMYDMELDSDASNGLSFRIGENAQINFTKELNQAIYECIVNCKLPYIYFGVKVLLLALISAGILVFSTWLCTKFHSIILVVVLSLINILGWFAREYLNHVILLCFGLILLWILCVRLEEKKKRKMCVCLFVTTCVLMVAGYFNPQNYTGEFIYKLSDENVLEQAYSIYEDHGEYIWCNYQEQSRDVFELSEDFIASKEVVLNFLKTDSEQTYQLVIADFKIYNNGFLIASIPWQSIRHSCWNLVNLSYDSDTLKMNCSESYAQMYLNQTFLDKINHSRNIDFTIEVLILYFLVAILWLRELETFLLRLIKLREETAGWKIGCVQIGILFCIAIGEVFFIENISESILVISLEAFILNIVLFFSMNLLLFAMTNLQISIVIMTITSIILGITNYYTVYFRGTPILPWDIYSVNTALSVAGKYEIYLTWKMMWWILAVIFLMKLGLKLGSKIKTLGYRKNWKGSCAGFLTGLLIGFMMIELIMNDSFLNRIGIVEDIYDQKNNYAMNGWGLATTLNLKYVNVEKPKGFSEEKIQEILSEYKVEEPQSGQEDLPNLVIILNESFSDLQSVYQIECEKEVMPFFRGVSGRNVAKGTCYVSQHGGTTCNTEYELLMGSTMAFFPQGSIVFQQHMNSEQYSLIYLLNQAGYTTVGMHPMPGSNWNRTKAYPLLQFQNVFFSDDLEHKEFIREYVSDVYCYHWIIEQFETKKEGEKLALYNMTVQNHGGYEDETYVADEFVRTGIALNQYLSLIHESDGALEELLSYFLQIDEKVVVLFLGDHQPKLPEDELDFEVYNLQVGFKVPYLLWNNFDQEMNVPEEISINYLATYLLDNCGIQISPYYSFLQSMSEEIPVINARGFKTAAGEEISWWENQSNEWIENYKILQYGLNSKEIKEKQKYYGYGEVKDGR